MGYRIKYLDGEIKTSAQFQMGKPAKRALCIIVSICTAVLLLSASGNMNKLRQWILPGNAEVTEAALSDLVTDLKKGEPIQEAITAFCREILDHADFPK